MTMQKRKPTELAPVDSIDSEDPVPSAPVSPKRPQTNYNNGRFMSLREPKKLQSMTSDLEMSKTQKPRK
jgi:hypothetical protein